MIKEATESGLPPLVVQPENPAGHCNRICLNMIVRNESPVIERALKSVSGIISYFVIVDTGSDDDTPQRIVDCMQRHNIAGEVHFREWRNFGHNRQQALELAVACNQAEWILFLDADEELGFDDTTWVETLERGITYRIRKHHGNIRYSLPQLIWSQGAPWQWRGVVHEYLEAPSDAATRELETARVIFHEGEGVRSRGKTQKEKFLADAALLEQALKESPDVARDRFYLAQSYRDAGELRKARANYAERVKMGGWAEEVYVAQCEKALLGITLGLDHTRIVSEHLEAFALRPTRAEALWQVASYCRQKKRYAEGYLFAKTGVDIPRPDDILFVRHDIYEWRMLDEFSICAYWIGRYQESATAGERLLAEGRYESGEKQRLEKNLEFANTALGMK